MIKYQKCNKCNVKKNLKNDFWHSKKSKYFKKICKECQNKRQKEWYNENHEEILKKQRKKRSDPEYKLYQFSYRLNKLYNIGAEEYYRLWKLQKGKCAICSIDSKLLKQRMMLDHNHETGKNRGLLCRKCNMALGLLNDNIKFLKTAISYLETKW